MRNTKFTTGAFVFTRARGLQPRDPNALQPLAAHHNLPGDMATIGSAISQTSSGLHKEGFLLHPIRRYSTFTAGP